MIFEKPNWLEACHTKVCFSVYLARFKYDSYIKYKFSQYTVLTCFKLGFAMLVVTKKEQVIAKCLLQGVRIAYKTQTLSLYLNSIRHNAV